MKLIEIAFLLNEENVYLFIGIKLGQRWLDEEQDFSVSRYDIEATRTKLNNLIDSIHKDETKKIVITQTERSYSIESYTLDNRLLENIHFNIIKNINK